MYLTKLNYLIFIGHKILLFCESIKLEKKQFWDPG